MRYQMRQRLLSIGDDYWIEDGQRVGIRDRFSIDVAGGGELRAKGNFVDHEYEIDREGRAIARVSKRWFRLRDTYGVEIEPGEDDALVLPIAVGVDALSHRGN